MMNNNTAPIRQRQVAANTVTELVADLEQNLGLNEAAVAGILGNAKVESGITTTAYNPSEGAIGLFQWEGSRRTRLQKIAASEHKSETDIEPQLTLLNEEVAGPYKNVISNIQNTSDPATAARYWDVGPGGANSGTGFENSSGSATSTREQYAKQFYSQLKSGQLQATTVPLGNMPTLNAGGSGQGVEGFKLPDPVTNFLGGGGLGGINPLSALESVNTFFHNLLWIFNKDHFYRMLLYVFGAIAIVAGLAMITFGAGHKDDE